MILQGPLSHQCPQRKATFRLPFPRASDSSGALIMPHVHSGIDLAKLLPGTHRDLAVPLPVIYRRCQ